MSDTSDRAVFVTGASGGIGVALTRALSRRGFVVYAGVRNPDPARFGSDPNVREVRVDVSDPASVIAAADHVSATLPRGAELRAVVNNAGLIVQGPVELVPTHELHHQFEVNVFGAVSVMQAFLPLLRAAAGGRVVNISAPTATVAMPFLGVLSASKAALESLSAAARVELAPWGIPVVIVQPGAVDTEIFAKAGARQAAALDGAPADRVALYRPSLDAVAATIARQRLRPVDGVVKTIVEAVTARNPRPRYRAGVDARSVGILSRLPTRLRDRVLTSALGLRKIRPGTPPEAGRPVGVPSRSA